jgi:hypothetical protein
MQIVGKMSITDVIFETKSNHYLAHMQFYPSASLPLKHVAGAGGVDRLLDLTLKCLLI